MKEIIVAPLLHDPVADRLGYQLRRASSVMMADLGAALAEEGLRPVEATILILIGANPGCTQSDLGRTLGIKRANMVPLIAGLGEKGMVAKAPVDGRSQALSLTEAGATRCVAVNAVMDTVEGRFERMLGLHDVPALREALNAIVEASGKAG